MITVNNDSPATSEDPINPPLLWKRCYSPDWNQYYYYRVDTKETQWHVPPEMSELQPTGNTQNTRPHMGQCRASVDIDEIVEDEPSAPPMSDMNGFDCQSNLSNEFGQPGTMASDLPYPPELTNTRSNEPPMVTRVQSAKMENINVSNGPPNMIEDGNESKMESMDDIPSITTRNGVITVTQDDCYYWSIGANQTDKYRLENYASAHYRKQKSMLKTLTLSQLLQWSSYHGMSAPLTVLDKQDASSAKQMWKNINSYMRDRKSSKNGSAHIDKILTFAYKASPQLCDEIYCQLCKKTTNNPDTQSLKLGWQLMGICCSIFPPSNEFACFLACYFYENILAGSEYATYALRALDGTMSGGIRSVAPLQSEINHIEARQPIAINIYFLDNNYQTLLVSPQTRVSQLKKSLSAFGFKHNASFGLFEMENINPNYEKQLYSDRRFIGKQRKIDELHLLPYDRELDDNERVMDVISSWTRDTEKEKRNIQLVYRCKIFSPLEEQSFTPNEWTISFFTVLFQVLRGYYLIGDTKHAYELAAIQLQALYSEEEGATVQDGDLINELQHYLPHSRRDSLSFRPRDAEAGIMKQHQKYQHLSKMEAYQKYFELLRTEASPLLFGLSFFRCVQLSNIDASEMCDDILMGIGKNGIVCIDPSDKTMVLQLAIGDITNYGMVRGDVFGLDTKSGQYLFATKHGKQIMDLLKTYFD